MYRFVVLVTKSKSKGCLQLFLSELLFPPFFFSYIKCCRKNTPHMSPDTPCSNTPKPVINQVNSTKPIKSKTFLSLTIFNPKIKLTYTRNCNKSNLYKRTILSVHTGVFCCCCCFDFQLFFLNVFCCVDILKKKSKPKMLIRQKWTTEAVFLVISFVCVTYCAPIFVTQCF